MPGKLVIALLHIYIAYSARLPTTEIFNSKTICCVVHKLVQDGYLCGFTEVKEGKKLLLYLKYYEGKPVLKHLTIISRPTQPVNLSWRKLRLSYKTGYVLVLTKKGLVTRAEALSSQQGGLLVCQIW
jgi:small subunit ribosomal protein S8